MRENLYIIVKTAELFTNYNKNVPDDQQSSQFTRPVCMALENLQCIH